MYSKLLTFELEAQIRGQCERLIFWKQCAYLGIKCMLLFVVTIFISFFTCTCYHYKTFKQYQKKKERKEKPLAKRKSSVLKEKTNTLVEWSKKYIKLS